MSFLEYLPAAVSLGVELYGSWHRPGFVRLREQLLGRKPSEAACVLSDPPVVAASSVAEIVQILPPGAVLSYEAADGSRLIVWWIERRPADGGTDGYWLW
ncbi:hypothetical protein [Streptomyces tubercidicus]|uniref:hypothetical protein n=1 Tax=Streptomyces tubercidicus TaxID=47759 RepID=UPI0022B79C47|nr:hypothetical protein [Streptomyces tubercidicus]WAU09971.1 hypothetical protein STRTU_000001 [Streptomyces tubercidicus]WAU16356.1 hypothetical protein STRTU_007171 [Streptomyces tubercidicus]